VTRTGRRLVTGALVTATATVMLVPVASADETQVTLTPSFESWYQPNPTCAQVTGCVTPDGVTSAVGVPTSPYPAGTLHVGVDAGTETARAYLRFLLAQDAGTLSSAHVEIPLDVASENGNAQPETAHVLVCLTKSAITKSEGSLNEPPRTDCSAGAALTYAATPAPHLTGDLRPLLAGLATGAALALIPDAANTQPTDTWHIVFSAHDRPPKATVPADRPASGPAILRVTIRGLDQDAEQPAAGLPLEEPQPGSQVIDAPGGTDFAPAPSTVLAQPGVPPSGPQVAASAPPVASAVRATAGYARLPVGAAYPLVWLLPLALLMLVPYLGKTLLMDLDSRTDSP
jgi:hypothetical protein